MTEEEYIPKVKSHIGWEEGMDDTMLPFYIKQGKNYVLKATGKEVEYLVIMCSGIFYDYRVAEKELSEALDAITPFIVQEVYSDLEEPAQDTSTSEAIQEVY
ncbi:phage gp6-like head-tail connector protein [Rossellomorea vietnamensis]|uniref:Phage gp6-like head-tail connector protein n=1 Tax=Rossellomorea vietnamensis TaxID=218284 RepID=A0A5D4NJN6_9BACI|nr:phage gp6-like head-tail connector protein [Rossellomorea vietnamensis]TYS14277.1 phage gp6-like head-tail connector protein [Rossellomorea vietnamensis]